MRPSPSESQNSVTTPGPHPARIITFDILRPILVVPVLMLHSWEHLVGEDIPTLSPDETHYEIYRQVVGTFFNYAALYIVGISFFLWGLKNAKLKPSKLLVFVLGVIGRQELQQGRCFISGGQNDTNFHL